MTFKTTSILAVTAALGLSACTSDGTSLASRTYNNEAGWVLDGGTFGNATMNNNLAQTGAADFAVSLSRRFAEEVPTTVNFAFNSATLDAEAQAILRQQADWIRQFPELRFKVFGHTDLVGSGRYNRTLGMRRARTVVNFLVSQGISRDRLEAVISRGETQPLIVTEGRERANRRTVTDVTGFVRSHPTVLNGKYAEVVFREYVESATPTTDLSTAQGSELATGE